MGRKPVSVKLSEANARPRNAAAVSQAPAVTKPRRTPGREFRIKVLAALFLITAAGGAYLAYEQFRVIRLAGTVRHAFAARRIEEAREPLRRWLALQPGSGEAYYFKAWAALAADQPDEAAQAIDQARKLGFDRALLDCLLAIGQSRSDRFKEAEPILEEAALEQVEPKDMVAKELARIYISSYRLDQAARAIEQWRTLAPEDPQPYIWRNEILSRSEVGAAVPIQNYRAALERDPNLDKARLGLAQQLSKARRFDEAEQEFLTYLKRKPNDATALLGLGRNAFQVGEVDEARRYFQSALEANPRQPDALKELSQIDLRLGRFQKACESLERLTQINPFDPEVRYSYAQALKLTGDDARSKLEFEQSVRLRKEQEEIVQLRNSSLQDSNNLSNRLRVAKWMFDHGLQDEGLKWTKEILRVDPRHVPTHELLAEYYGKEGDAGLANYHRVMASAGRAEGGASSDGAKARAPR
jgi:tetratricopeptide (TPR) repeat protein